MPVQIRREDALAVRARLGVIHPAECRPFPGGLIAFDDEGAHRGGVAVTMGDEGTVPVAAEGEREAIEALRRAVPREAVGEQLDLRLEQGSQRRTHERIRSVGAHHDVRACELVGRRHGAAILDPHARVTAQPSQDFLERKAPDGGKAVAVDVHALVAVHDALHRPAFHRRLYGVREPRLIALEKRQRAGGEDDPESVGRPFGILLGDPWAPTLPSLPLTFTILPFVIWMALRFGWREVSALNALVCILAVWHTIEGRGPFASAPLGTSLLLLLAFMGTVVFTGLVLNTVVGERGRAFEALAQALKTLKEEAIRDPLTNLYNRRFLRDYLSRELLRAAREGIRVAVIMIDLDRFKRVNDTAGHAAGDLVLTEIA